MFEDRFKTDTGDLSIAQAARVDEASERLAVVDRGREAKWPDQRRRNGDDQR